MARKLRIQYADAIYHVMSRGDRRQAIFADDPDRHRFVETLTQACQKTGWQVHAYCLMENHFHLVVETPQPNLVSGMKWLLGTYTSRYNRRDQSIPSVPWDAFKNAKTPINRPLGRWDALKSGAGGARGTSRSQLNHCAGARQAQTPRFICVACAGQCRLLCRLDVQNPSVKCGLCRCAGSTRVLPPPPTLPRQSEAAAGGLASHPFHHSLS